MQNEKTFFHGPVVVAKPISLLNLLPERFRAHMQIKNVFELFWGSRHCGKTNFLLLNLLPERFRAHMQKTCSSFFQGPVIVANPFFFSNLLPERFRVHMQKKTCFSFFWGPRHCGKTIFLLLNLLLERFRAHMKKNTCLSFFWGSRYCGKTNFFVKSFAWTFRSTYATKKKTCLNFFAESRDCGKTIF